MSEPIRGWIYRSATAIGALVIFYGIASADEVAVWMGVVTAVSNGLASTKTTIRRGGGKHSADK